MPRPPASTNESQGRKYTSCSVFGLVKWTCVGSKMARLWSNGKLKDALKLHLATMGSAGKLTQKLFDLIDKDGSGQLDEAEGAASSVAAGGKRTSHRALGANGAEVESTGADTS